MKIKLLVLLVLGLSILFSEYIDKVELHNGTIYEGIIILQKPGEYIKIETKEGVTIKIILDDVKFISKEKVKSKEIKEKEEKVYRGNFDFLDETTGARNISDYLYIRKNFWSDG